MLKTTPGRKKSKKQYVGSEAQGDGIRVVKKPALGRSFSLGGDLVGSARRSEGESFNQTSSRFPGARTEFGIRREGGQFGTRIPQSENFPQGGYDNESQADYAPGAADALFGERSRPPLQSFDRREQQARRREAEELNWGQARDKLFDEYIRFYPGKKAAASAFASFQTDVLLEALGTVSGCAHCGSESFRPASSATILFVSTTFRTLLPVPLFWCEACHRPFHQHPFQIQAFPSTPLAALDLTVGQGVSVPVWFAQELLDLADCLVFSGKRAVSIEHIAKSITSFHELSLSEADQSLLLPQDTLRKLLGKAWEEHGLLRHRVGNLSKWAVSGFQRGPFGACGGCHTAGGLVNEDGVAEDSAVVPLHSVYVDFCFKMPHLASAALASRVLKPHIAEYILDDDEAKEFLQLPNSSIDAGDSTCSDFHADTALGRKSSKYDITAFGGLFCRHGFLGLGMNCFTGERYAYATFLLFTLFTVYNLPIQFFYYDIGCRYKSHFAAWLATQAATIIALATSMRFPNPPWHHYAHSAACQAANSSRDMEGAGRGAGEPPEAAWSFMGMLGKILQYRSLASRADFLERLRAVWNAEKGKRLPSLLVKMHKRAREQVHLAEQEERSLAARALQMGIDLDEVQPVPPEPASGPVVEDWVLEYVRLRLQLARMDDIKNGAVPEADLLFGQLKAFAKLRPGSEYGARLGRALGALERKFGDRIGRIGGEVQHWPLDSARFFAAFLQLRRHESERLQQSIATQVHELSYVEDLFQKVAGRAGEVKRLRKVVQKAKAEVKTLFTRYLSWVAADSVAKLRGGATGASPDPELTRYQSTCKDWPLERIVKAEFPWAADGEAGRSGESAVAQELQRRRLRAQRDKRRAIEELGLVEREAGSTLSLYEKQLIMLERAIEETKARLEVDACADSEGDPADDYDVGTKILLEEARTGLCRQREAARAFFATAKLVPLDQETTLSDSERADLDRGEVEEGSEESDMDDGSEADEYYSSEEDD